MKDDVFKVSARKDLFIQVPYDEDSDKKYRELNSVQNAIIHYLNGNIAAFQFDKEIEVCRSWSVFQWYCNIPALMRIVHDLPKNIQLTWDVLIRESLVRELEEIVRFEENVDDYSINLFIRLKVIVKCIVKALNND